MRKSLVFVALLVAAVAFAQSRTTTKAPTDQDLLITSAQLDSILQNAPIAKDTGKPGSVSAQLFNGGGGPSSFGTAFIRLDEPDKPHAHGDTNEVYIIKEGSGTLETGGTMIGPFTDGAVHRNVFVNSDGGQPQAGQQQSGQQQPGRGQFAPPSATNGGGTAIEGGRFQQVGPGDLIYIPATVPHTWTAIEKPVVYWDIKFPKTQ